MFILTSLYLLFLSLKLTLSLEAVTISQRLPSPRLSVKALYDGEDSVFLLGGRTSQSLNGLDEVLQFSLSTEELQIVGRFPDGIGYGSAEFAHGYTYYLGGFTNSGRYSSYIWTTSQTRLNPYPIAKMSARIVDHCSVFDGEDSIYIFGGNGDNDTSSTLTIQKYTRPNDTTEVISTLPYGIIGCASVWFNNSAYLFGGINNGSMKTIIKFTPSAQGNDLDILPVEMPLQFSFGTALTDGKYIYLVLGFSAINATSIAVFDPTTLSFTVENVTNLEGKEGGSIYVAKTNRVYIFGGINQATGAAFDRIRYINL